MQDHAIRRQLVNALTKPEAHAVFKDLHDISPEYRGVLLPGQVHTAWEILEHLRICQLDILEYCRDASGHESPEFPEGLWPKEVAPKSNRAWEKSVAGFKSDLKAMCELIMDKTTDLTVSFSNGSGHTVLREALVLARHNSYHFGQLALIVKAAKEQAAD